MILLEQRILRDLLHIFRGIWAHAPLSLKSVNTYKKIPEDLTIFFTVNVEEILTVCSLELRVKKINT